MKQLAIKIWNWLKQIRARDLFLSRLAKGELVLRRAPVRANLTQSEHIKKLLEKELRRLGWPTSNVRVRMFSVLIKGGKEPKWEQQFFVNLGSYRGLDPNQLYTILRNLDSKCGHKEILRCVSLMEERVEPCAV